ncbi:hypothetical protein SK128_017280 [Halocaridina rubra]|uniref:Uncharacterized protein n=1 Tax=Halocaridina rubra TaxID=373956 RepID=A0AAN8X517_HALRR
MDDKEEEDHQDNKEKRTKIWNTEKEKERRSLPATKEIELESRTSEKQSLHLSENKSLLSDSQDQTLSESSKANDNKAEENYLEKKYTRKDSKHFSKKSLLSYSQGQTLSELSKANHNDTEKKDDESRAIHAEEIVERNQNLEIRDGCEGCK